MASLTDLALGLVTLVLAPRVPRDVEGARYWRATFAWTAVTALIGAVFHGFLIGVPRIGEISWAVMSVMIVVLMSYLLAASVVQVLGRERTLVFWPLRLVGFLAYAVIAASGHPSITAMMWCESVTMACVVGLWVWAGLQRHPAGRPVLVAIGVSVLAGLLRLVPGASTVLRLDPDSAYHVGQVLGMVLLFRALVGHGRRVGAADGPRVTARPRSAR